MKTALTLFACAVALQLCAQQWTTAELSEAQAPISRAKTKLGMARNRNLKPSQE